MKNALAILLSVIFCSATAQNMLMPKQNELYQQRNDAARTFIDVVLNSSRNFLEPAKKVVMLKNDKTIDTLDFTKDTYQGGGQTIAINPVKPSYYTTLEKYMCTSVNPTEKAGCAVNVKKLTYILKGDFNNFHANGLKRVGDTLEVTINFPDDTWINCFKFGKSGLIESATTFEIDQIKHKTLRGENKYFYDKNGNLTKKEATEYPPANIKNAKLPNSFLEVDFSPQGNEDREIKKRYQYDDKGALVKTYFSGSFFFYNAKSDLIKKQVIVDDKLLFTYLLNYKDDVVEVTKTTDSVNKTELLFSYRLIK